MNWLTLSLTLVAITLVLLLVWRALDKITDNQAWGKLKTYQPNEGGVFHNSMLDGLPEPAQRYFQFTISPGTPISVAAEIRMSGAIGLGNQKEPNYQDMQAHQILVPPHGFVWKLNMRFISGSDGMVPEKSWTKFWLFGVLPIVRAKGQDHQRSAFGRVISEATFWSPASLLPNKYVVWEQVNKDCARAHVTYQGLTQAVDITVTSSGAPTKVVIQRWSNENTEKKFQQQPFGGFLSEFREFDGYTLPTRIEGGNHIDTPDYFPFFKASVSTLRFLAEPIK